MVMASDSDYIYSIVRTAIEKRLEIVGTAPFLTIYSPLTGEAIQVAITEVGSGSLMLGPGTWVISADLTIPAAISIHVPKGAILSVASGKTLTINGTLVAEPYQIFSGDGTVVFGTARDIYPEWWGATGNGITNDQAAFAKAINSLSSGSILLSDCTYLIGSSLTVANLSLIGRGKLLFTSGNLNVHNDGVRTIHIKDFTLSGASMLIDSSNRIIVQGCTIEDHTDSGIFIYRNCLNIQVLGNKIINVGTSATDAKGIGVSGYYGGQVVPCTDILISGNILIASGTLGIESWHSNERITICNNIIKGIGKAYGTAISVDTTNNSVVSNNTIEKTDLAIFIGIELAKVTKTIVQGNTIKGVDYGINVGGIPTDTTDCLIDGNGIWDAAVEGIRICGLRNVVSNNFIKDAAIYVIHNFGGTNIVLKNNTGNSLSDVNGSALFNNNGTMYAEGNRLTCLAAIPVQSYNTAAILTVKNNYFGESGEFTWQETSGGKIIALGDISLVDPIGYNSRVRAGVCRSEITGYFRGLPTTPPFTIRVKHLKSSGGQLPVTFSFLWSGGYLNAPKGGQFLLSFGSATTYNQAPTLVQMGDTVNISSVAYDGSGYPYWDITLTVDVWTHIFVTGVGVGSDKECYQILTV